MSARRHPSLFGDGDAPESWVFVVDPPGSLGPIVGAWTNQRAEGALAIPLSLRLMDIGLWAMGGFVLGLVSIFAVGGYLESQHVHFDAASWFLYALAIGTGLGTMIGVLRSMRPPGVLTLFVGERGCAQVSGRGADARSEPLLFDNVTSFRTEIDVMRHQGITTRSRLVYVTEKGKKERLWYLSKVAEEAGKDDPQFHFVECVLRAYDARPR